MKNSFLILTLILLKSFDISSRQKISKPPLDTSAYRKWHTLSSPLISNDGKFASYTIDNLPSGSKTLVILSTDGKWEKKLPGDLWPKFIDDSKHITLQKLDSLFILHLGVNKIDTVANLKNIKYPVCDNNYFITYQKGKDFVLRNINNNKEYIIIGGNQYTVSLDNRSILVKIDREHTTTLRQIWLRDKKEEDIWKDNNIENFILDKNGNQVIILTQKKDIWYSNTVTKKERLIFSSQNDLPDNLQLSRIVRFNNDGSKLYIKLKEKEFPLRNADVADLDIWTYKDLYLQPAQRINSSPKEYLGVITIDSGIFIRIQQSNEDIKFENDTDVSSLWKQGVSRQLVNGKLTFENFLISTITGRKIFFPNEFTLSPDGRFIVYYDEKANGIFSYEIASETTSEISKGINIDWKQKEDNDADWVNAQFRGIAGWINKEESVLIYDNYDIWKIHLRAKKKPVNITNKYGRDNRIIFKLLSNSENKIYNEDILFLVALNRQSKLNGFYSVSQSAIKNPKLLSEGPYLYLHPNPSNPSLISGLSPIKAKYAKKYLLSRMSSTESPNYFITSDFTHFVKITNIEPEEKYNWYTTELHTWKTDEGYSLQGILYKPENFDSTKSYPLIFNYYRKISDNLNAYIKPVLSNGKFNIPWYVSNGYLVFTPDIHYTIGQTGNSALSSITSAVKYLSKFPYINHKRLGLQGISFGGFETNYIITHTNIFAAACSASGLYDLVSAYNSVNLGDVKQYQFENGPYQIGSTLWENPNLYIENSAVFYANKVTTPLLMMQTTDDSTIPLANAIEFFVSLQRLGKKVWMLQYNNGNHGVMGKESEDFDLRMRQFFDYYLKEGSSAPKWMTQGRPAKLKGIDSRLDLDSVQIKP